MSEQYRTLRLFAATAVTVCLLTVPAASAQTSAPAILQWFDGSYKSMERRAPDYFGAGYGGLWIPPTGRADSGNQSVGYDAYDRFDLGRPNNPTLYGAETGLKTTVSIIQRAAGRVYMDIVWNHNGFRDSNTPGFASGGGYPGFVLSAPGQVNGDFHSANVPPGGNGDLLGRLSGLIDQNHSTNIQLIRTPVNPADSRNIPAPTNANSTANRPAASNARFYPDRAGNPARVLFDPTTGEANIPVYDFNLTTPLSGDAVSENGLGLLMRNTQWLVQTIGVDGFRLDATKHFDPWVLNYFDRAVYRTIKKPLLDGSQQHVFSFGEFLDGDSARIQSTIRKDIRPNEPGRIGGNRDALDFPLFFALTNNLTANGVQNDWRNIINASLDRNDDGLANNGSQGVAFAQSHDSFPAALNNVAHAFVLLRPGNVIVYYNGKEFGQGRDFPKDGRGDALGGQFGTAVTRLVDIRSRYAEGNFNARLAEKETLIIERENSLLSGLSNRGDSGFDARTVATAFAPGTPLIELTGNAADATVDPTNDIPELLVVSGDRTVNLRVPRNRAPGTNGAVHGRGYVIYGPSGPQGSLSLTNVTQTLAPDPATNNTNGTARVSAISVIRSNSFTVTLQTNTVNLLGFYRDPDADGDNALLKLNAGVDLNGNGVVDNVSPSAPSYGFESFLTKSSPRATGGDGQFVQTIDATALAEGTHFIEVRAFRKRNAGEPSIFSAWRQSIYIDRLPPVSAVASFEPVVAGVSQNRRVEVRSIDLTANNVHTFLNLPAALTDAQIIAQLNGNSQAAQADRDLWQRNYNNLTSGNQVITIVSFEETGTVSVQRFPGLLIQTPFGGGLGDLDFNGLFQPADITLFGSVLLSFNRQFNPAADLSADGLVDFTDLALLGDRLIAVGASNETLIAYNLLTRGVIPEPASGVLLISAMLPLLTRRRCQTIRVVSCHSLDVRRMV